MLKTSLCRQLGIEYPIFSVGFGVAARPELAAAVSNAGGCGVLGTSGLPAPYVRQQIQRLHTLTRKPFGVSAANAGVDAVIAQGVEAGGHVRGRISLSTLLPAVVEAVTPIPVIAAGGIADGRGLVAALSLGAQAVSMGTRFVASEEAGAAEQGRERVGGRRTPCKRSASGRGEVIGTVTRAGTMVNIPRYAATMLTADFKGDAEYAPLWAGESCSLVNDIKPAAQIVRDIMRDAEDLIAQIKLSP